MDGGQNANSEPSNPGQPLKEPTLSDVNATLQKVLQKLDSHDGTLRALQSGKDKAVTRIEKSNQELYQIIGQRLGVPIEKVQEAQRQSVLDEMVNERLAGNNSQQQVPPGSGTQPGTQESFDSASIKQVLGLPSNDPRVAELDRLYGNDPNTYMAKAVELRDQIKTQSAPTPAEMPLASGSGTPSLSDTDGGLQQAYERDRAKLFEQHGAGTDAFIRAHSKLQDDYAEKGLNF